MREPVGRRRAKSLSRRKPETTVYKVSKSWDTRWTPNTEELRDLLQVAVSEAGSARALAGALPMKYRHLRRILNGETKAVSLRIVDRILVRSSVSDQILQLPWLTVEQLVEQGIWKEQKTWVAAKYRR